MTGSVPIHNLSRLCPDNCQAISPSDGITLKKRQSLRHPEEVLSDLAYADDIALLENVLKEAEDSPLHRVEEASQSIDRLFLNAGKTKFMRLNPPSDDQMLSLDGSEIGKVDDFLSLGSYTETSHDIDTRIGKAWGGLNALSKVWVSPIKKATKMRLFKGTVECILLHGSDSWSLTKSLEKKLDGTYACNAEESTKYVLKRQSHQQFSLRLEPSCH